MSTRLAPLLDRAEIDKFDRLARDWWDPDGPMRPLHRINPVRLGFVRDAICRHLGRDARAPFSLEGVRALDVGCGAGLLSEPLARLGAEVTGLEPAGDVLEVARRHAEAGGLAIAFSGRTVEAVAASDERFDVVLALEVVEHVPDVERFVRACAEATRPGGLVILSTLNRTLRAFALAIVGAEYVLRWLPRGTHDWDRFVTPAELRRATERAGLTGFRPRGMGFDPLRDAWRLSDDTAVNYLAVAGKPA